MSLQSTSLPVEELNICVFTIVSQIETEATNGCNSIQRGEKAVPLDERVHVVLINIINGAELGVLSRLSDRHGRDEFLLQKLWHALTLLDLFACNNFLQLFFKSKNPTAASRAAHPASFTYLPVSPSRQLPTPSPLSWPYSDILAMQLPSPPTPPLPPLAAPRFVSFPGSGAVAPVGSCSLAGCNLLKT